PHRVELGSPARPSTRVFSLPSLAIPIDEGVVEVAHDAGHHVLELDGHGDAMAEDHEEAEAHSHQNDAGAGGELRNELARALLPRDHEGEQGVDEGREKETDGDLGDRILHEAIEDGRTELTHPHEGHEGGNRAEEGG